ncbi:MAG: chemical-damaging agent resistance protein C [Candidatus Epulonipiscioides saccharophilum]|nr:MAG: chemical-damaging agent resistance protein C [Epulopiscium sp. AS2M-Bin001]
MAIQLKKGQKIALDKDHIPLSKLIVGLGWDTNKYSGGHQFDLDTSIFMLNSSDQVCNDDDFIFYGNLKHKSGAIIHTGDNRTGEGDGDDETISVDLSLVPENVCKIVFAVTIYDAEERNQNFGIVSNSFIRIIDANNSNEILRYDLGEDFSIETALVVGEIYKYKGSWKFAAIGSGYSGGLAALCKRYSVNI